MQIPFHLVDVFADQPLTGNPLAVVPQANELDDSTMQSIARVAIRASIFKDATMSAVIIESLRKVPGAGVQQWVLCKRLWRKGILSFPFRTLSSVSHERIFWLVPDKPFSTRDEHTLSPFRVACGQSEKQVP